MQLLLLLHCTRYAAADCAAYLGVPGPPPTLKGTPTVEIYLQDCTQLFCISRGFFVVAVAVSVVVAVPIVVLEVFEQLRVATICVLKNKLHGFSFAFYFYGFSFAFPLRSPHAVHSSSTTTVSFHFKAVQSGRYLYLYLYLTANVSAYLGLSVVAYLGEWVMRLNCTNLDINRGWQGKNQYRLAFRLIMPHQGKFQMRFDRGHSGGLPGNCFLATVA